MATLFQRISGIGLSDSPLPEDRKIPIHAFIAAINEVRNGKITAGEFSGFFNLTASQQQDAITLRDLVIAAPDKMAFLRVFKDWLYLAETETDARYTSAANLVSRLQTEITDQGGTLP